MAVDVEQDVVGFDVSERRKTYSASHRHLHPRQVTWSADAAAGSD